MDLTLAHDHDKTHRIQLARKGDQMITPGAPIVRIESLLRGSRTPLVALARR